MFLKQSTATTISVGPFVDETDGKTPETALSIAYTDVMLSKAGAALANKNDTTAATADSAGFYRIPLNTTDTNTVGNLRISIQVSGALPWFANYEILTAEEYNIRTGVDSYATTLGTISSGVTSANGTLASVSGGVTSIGSDVSTINSNVSTVKTTTNNTYNTVGTINTNVNTANSTLSSVSTAVSGVASDLITANGTLASVSGGVSAITSTIGTVDSNVSTIKTTTNNTYTALGVVDGNVDSLVTALSALASAVDSLDADTATAVWSAVERTLTSSSGGATAEEVWAYASRTLTSLGSLLGSIKVIPATATTTQYFETTIVAGDDWEETFSLYFPQDLTDATVTWRIRPKGDYEMGIESCSLEIEGTTPVFVEATSTVPAHWNTSVTATDEETVTLLTSGTGATQEYVQQIEVITSAGKKYSSPNGTFTVYERITNPV